VELRAKGIVEEEIARIMQQTRRDLGVKYKDLSAGLLKEYIYEVNKGRYNGDPLGGSFKFFMEKYNGNYQKIIEGSMRPNPVSILY
jgi:hypothetical protein